MSEKHPFAIYGEPGSGSSSLVVGWSQDAGSLGPRVIDYLVDKLGGKEFGEIEPEGFFPLGGVSVEDGIAQFPESKFYCCPEKNLVILRSDSPTSEWYRFLNLALDVSEHYCHAKELYTVGGMVYLGAHTTPRQLLAIANSPEMRGVLAQHDLASDIDYETPIGQRPTLNACLLWVAQKRNIPAANLWVPVPFYLMAAEDPKAWRKPIEFLDSRLGLEIDFGDLDEEVLRQNTKMAQLRSHSPEVDDCIQKLESNLMLTHEENERLVREVEEFLRRRG